MLQGYSPVCLTIPTPGPTTNPTPGPTTNPIPEPTPPPTQSPTLGPVDAAAAAFDEAVAYANNRTCYTNTSAAKLYIKMLQSKFEAYRMAVLNSTARNKERPLVDASAPLKLPPPQAKGRCGACSRTSKKFSPLRSGTCAPTRETQKAKPARTDHSLEACKLYISAANHACKPRPR